MGGYRSSQSGVEPRLGGLGGEGGDSFHSESNFEAGVRQSRGKQRDEQAGVVERRRAERVWGRAAYTAGLTGAQSVRGCHGRGADRGGPPLRDLEQSLEFILQPRENRCSVVITRSNMMKYGF